MSKFNYITFFDADETIFNFDIKNSFLEYFLIETLPVESYARRAFEKYMNKNNKNSLKGASGSFLNREYFKNFSGMPVKLLSEIGYSWYYKSKLEINENFFKQTSIFEIEMHKRNSAQIVVLSSSFLPCLEPLLDEFCINSLVCTNLEIINGYYTGNILSDPINVDGKTKAIENFLLTQRVGLKNSNSVNLEQLDAPFCDIAYDYTEDIANYFTSERMRNLYRN